MASWPRDGSRPPPDGATRSSTFRMNVLRLLESKEGANEAVARIWGFEVDTVPALFNKFEERNGRLSNDDLKDLLRLLGYLRELDIIVSRRHFGQCDRAFPSLTGHNSQNQGAVIHDPTPHQDRDEPLSTKDVQRKSRSKDLHVDPNKCDEDAAGNLTVVPDSIGTIDDYSQTAVAALAMIPDQGASRAATQISHDGPQVVDFPCLPLEQGTSCAHYKSGTSGHRDVKEVSGINDAKQSESILDPTAESIVKLHVQSAEAIEDSGSFSMASAATTTPPFLEHSLPVNSEGIPPDPSTEQHAIEDTGMNQTAHETEFEVTDSTHHNSSHLSGVVEQRPISPVLAHRPGSRHPVVTGSQPSNASQSSSGFAQGAVPQSNDAGQGGNFCQTGNPSSGEDSYTSLYLLVKKQEQKINSLGNHMLILTQESASKTAEICLLRRLRLEMQLQCEDQERLNSQLQEENAELRRLLDDSATMEAENQDSLRKLYESCQIKDQENDTMKEAFRLYDAQIDSLSHLIEAQNQERLEMRETVDELTQLFQENLQSLTQRVQEDCERRVRLEYEQQLEDLAEAMNNDETDEYKIQKRDLQEEENRRLRDLVIQSRCREEPLSEDSPVASNAEDLVEDVEDTPSHVASDESSSSEGDRRGSLASTAEPDEGGNDPNHVPQDDIDGNTDNVL